jgi:hypothetical protein
LTIQVAEKMTKLYTLNSVEDSQSFGKHSESIKGSAQGSVNGSSKPKEKVIHVKEINTSSSQQFHKEKGPVRMKLKDYIYRTQITSNRAFFRRRPCAAKKDEALDEAETMDTEKSRQSHALKKKTTSTTTYKEEKYTISNRKMHEILKHEIQSDLHSMVQTLKLLESRVCQIEPSSNISNEDLVSLYNARRLIK